MEYSVTEIAVEICNRLGIDVKGQTAGNVMTNCIFHEDKNPSLSISLDEGLFHCFSCGESGTLRSLYYHQTGHGILKDLGINRTQIIEPIKFTPPDFEQLPETSFKYNKAFDTCDNYIAPMKYLIEKRGFTKSQISSFNIKWCQEGHTFDPLEPDNKKSWTYFNNRILIPIYEQNKLISIEGRDILGEDIHKKYWIDKGNKLETFHYKKVLYPKGSSVSTLYQWEKLNKNETLWIVEGLMDLFSLRTSKQFMNSTAYFGVNITARQIYLLKKFKDVVIIPDNDKAGKLTLKKLKQENFTCKVLFPPHQVKDVNEILQGKHPFIKTIDEAIKKKWLTKIVDIGDIQ